MLKHGITELPVWWQDEDMTDPFEFDTIQPLEPLVNHGIRYSADMEVTPTIDRQAPFLWRHLFHDSCDKDPDLIWLGAGFARCAEDDVERVSERLNDITQSTNVAFAKHLAEATSDELLRLMAEGINYEPEEGDRYRIPYP